jgi:tripartite ATP-independent transporter DctM subunit
MRELGRAAWESKWEMAIPVIVLLSVVSGWATILEASAVAVVFAIVSQSVVTRDLHPLRDLPRVMVEGAALIGAVLILLGMAMGLTSYLVEAEIPAALLAWTRAHIESPILFLLVLNCVLLVLGSVLEIYSAIVILAPLLVPLAPAYGIDPLHLGIVFLANLELGFLVPPMGLNLILSSTRFGQPLTRLYKVTLPFLLISSLGLLLVTYVPALTTGVVDWLKS